MKFTNHEKVNQGKPTTEPIASRRIIGWDDPRSVAWRFIAQSLLEGRKRFGISKRQAARRAGISEASWRIMEAGGKNMKGAWFTPNPRPETLYVAARAVEVDPAPLFAAIGQEVPERLPQRQSEGELFEKIRRLSDRGREELEEFVDFLLSDQDIYGDEDGEDF